MAKSASPFPQDWQLVWGDEFDYSGAPDPEKWDYETGRIRNNEAQTYTTRAENARVEDGKLVIEARRETMDGAEYTSASLNTLGKFGFQYGRIEVRAQLPGARGSWPAAWMLGEDRSVIGWPRCGEIDIMEHVGHNPGVVHATLH
jgi:beta-glucanase (GH16 family)